MRVAAGDADWLLGVVERASESEALLALLGAVVVLWVEFPETGAAALFVFETGVLVSFCTGPRKLPEAAERASEVGAFLEMAGTLVSLCIGVRGFPEALLALLGAGAPVSLWRLSEAARRGVRSGEAAPEFVPASAVLDAAERKLEKAGELPRFAATRRAEASGA